MTDTTYNGWTNYETWNCKLWIDNEQSTQEYWREVAKWATVNPIDNQYMEKDRRIVHALADRLKEQFEEQAQEQVTAASFFTDILGAALNRVNWIEIAENLLEDVED